MRLFLHRVGKRKILLSLWALLNFFGSKAQDPFVFVNYPQFGTAYNEANDQATLLTIYNGLQNINVTKYQTDKNLFYYDARFLGNGGNPYTGLAPIVVCTDDQLYVDFALAGLFTGKFIATGTLTDKNPQYNGITYLYYAQEAWSILWAAQQFSRYLYNTFQWNGMLNDAFSLAGYFTYHVHPNWEKSFYDRNNRQVYIKSNYSSNLFPSEVSLDIVGHELAHAVFFGNLEAKGIPVLEFPGKTEDGNYSPSYGAVYEAHVISEAFADIMGVCLRRSIEPKPLWTIGDLQYSGGWRNFADPTLLGHPDTYYGPNWKKPDEPDYAPHIDADVLNYWFYLLVNGTPVGVTKVNGFGKPYTVNPLPPLTAEVSAAKLVFNTLVKRGGYDKTINFFKLRDLTLKTAVEDMGWPVGSPEYQTIVDAWRAIGVEIDPTQTYNPLPSNSNPCTVSLTWYNDFVPIDAMTVTLNPNPASPRFSVLKTLPANNLPEISTKRGYLELFADPNYNCVYDVDDDPTRSKDGVSVHWATEQTLTYFSKERDWNGVDGQGEKGMTVESYVGPSNGPNGYDPLLKRFYYKGAANPQDKPELSLDIIASHITKAIAYHKSGAMPNQNNEEAMAIYESIGQIFGVAVKNWYYKVVDANQWNWKFGDKVVGPQGEHDLRSPKTDGDPSMYLSTLYNAQINDPASLAGVMNRWFYLLTNGDSGYRDADPLNPNVDPGYGSYYLPGVGSKWSFQILFDLMGKLTGINSFADARDKTLAIVYGYNLPPEIGNELAANLKEAWYAVGVGDGAEDQVFSPEDNEQNAAMFPTTIGVKGKFDSGENFEIMVSEDPNFAAGVTLTQMCQGVFANSKAAFLDLYLDGSQTIFWKARPKKFKKADGSEVDAIAIALEPYQQEILWSGRRQFKTESYICKGLTPNNTSTYPWPTEFNWYVEQVNNQGDLPDVGAYDIRVAETQDLQTVDTYLDKADIPSEEKFTQGWKAPLKVGHPYWWVIQAVSKFAHSIHPEFDNGEERLAKGVISNTVGFETLIPKANCDIPVDGAEVSPFGDFLLEAVPLAGAKGYRFEISSDPSFSPGKTVPLLPDTWSADPDVQAVNQQMVGSELGDPKLGQMTDGKIYHWHAIPQGPPLPLNGGTIHQEGGAADQRSFQVDYSKVKATLLEPSSDAWISQIYSQDEVVFKWTQVAGATEYKISIYRTGEVTPMHEEGLVLVPGPDGMSNSIPNQVFYDDDANPNRSYYWKITAINDASLPEVASAPSTFHMDADIPVAIDPGADCSWPAGCDALYSNGNAPTIDLGLVSDITYEWTSRYHPWGYYLRTREYIAGQMTDWIWNGPTGNSTTQTLDENLFKGGKTYYYSVRAMPHDLANITPTDEAVNTVPSSGSKMFKVINGKDVNNNNVTLEFKLEEPGADNVDIYVILPDSYGANDLIDYACDSPDDGCPGIWWEDNYFNNQLDLITIQSPAPGDYQIFIVLDEYNVGCYYGTPHVKLSVWKNGILDEILVDADADCNTWIDSAEFGPYIYTVQAN